MGVLSSRHSLLAPPPCLPHGMGMPIHCLQSFLQSIPHISVLAGELSLGLSLSCSKQASEIESAGSEKIHCCTV
jgi:hypothetical protein